MKEEIIEIVTRHNGIKEVKLLLEVINLIFPQNASLSSIMNSLTELVKTKDIIKLEYTDSTLIPKNIYFTKETALWISGVKVNEGSNSKIKLDRKGQRDK